MRFHIPRCARAASLVFALPLLAQAPPNAAATKAEVMSVVKKLFDSMRAKDTAAMRSTLDTGAVLQSVSPRGLTKDAIADWLRSVASSPDTVKLDERIAHEVVQIDGGLATVWVDYWFFANARFNHCGVDTFMLTRRENGWKIFALADTRRREGCVPPPAP